MDWEMAGERVLMWSAEGDMQAICRRLWPRAVGEIEERGSEIVLRTRWRRGKERCAMARWKG